MKAFAALADPTRRSIVELLADGELDAGAIAAHFPVSRPAISRHLRVLREAGVVVSHPDGQRRVYVLEPQALAEIDGWLGRYRRFWADRLDALERHLESSKEGS